MSIVPTQEISLPLKGIEEKSTFEAKDFKSKFSQGSYMDIFTEDDYIRFGIIIDLYKDHGKPKVSEINQILGSNLKPKLKKHDIFKQYFNKRRFKHYDFIDDFLIEEKKPNINLNFVTEMKSNIIAQNIFDLLVKEGGENKLSVDQLEDQLGESLVIEAKEHPDNSFVQSLRRKENPAYNQFIARVSRHVNSLIL